MNKVEMGVKVKATAQCHHVGDDRGCVLEAVCRVSYDLFSFEPQGVSLLDGDIST